MDATNLSLERQATRGECFHPAEPFVEFTTEEIEQSIPERFEKIVQLYPDRLAVKVGDQTLTYEQLNQAANRIARAILAQRGPGQESVALLLDNDVSAIASILGVLKSGKIYVPLDSAEPSRRIQHLLADSGSQLIITDGKHFAHALALAGERLAVLSVDALENLVEVDPPPALSPDAPAYLLYTSGSTGDPKGVLQNHRNVLHLIMRYTNSSRICPEDRIALLRAFSVHGGTLLTFAALLNGAAILPFDVKNSGVQELAKWVEDEEISVCRLGPTLFRHLMASIDRAHRFSGIRAVSFSGEPLYEKDLELFRRHFSASCLLTNTFGSTEVSSCCEYIVDGQTRFADGRVPCGYATTDMEVFVVDEANNRVGPNQVGEIAVRSRYLAVEYWRNPALTESKFLADSGRAGTRTYLTGDLGRIPADGCLLFVGRKDFQVKIRGYRVELEEIEAALLALGTVHEAAIFPDADRANETRLVAYVVPKAASAPLTASGYRRALKESLPDPMIPAVFVTLERLPLTRNGKIDRRQLPAPDTDRPALDAPFVAPRNPVEEQLVGMWSEILSWDRIGVHDNFFDLGGHSLAAGRVVSLVIEKFQLEIPLRLFFEAPTVAELAVVIQAHHGQQPILPLRRRAKRALAPLSFAQERLWFLNQLEPESPVYNESRAMRWRGVLDMTALRWAVNRIVERHEVLRTTIAMESGAPMQRIADPCDIELPLLDLRGENEDCREEKARQVLREALRRPFDLARDFPWRFLALRLAEDEHIILVVMHHVATDGWSSTVFWRELAVLYKAAVAPEESSALPELPIQYQDYAEWQRGEVLERQLSYWEKQLAGLGALQLPTDRPRPAVQSFQGAQHSFVLPKDLTEQLKDLSRKEGATFFMTLLAAFQTLLYRYSGQEDIAVGCPIAGRTRQELEGLIGFFVNTLVMRGNFSGNPTFRELLARVREVTLDAYGHQELPFEKLVEALNPERDLSRNALFQATFRLRNYPDQLVEISDVTMERFELDSGVAKFDLSLAMRDNPDGLGTEIVYNTDLFESATIQRMFGHLQVLLKGMVANPDQRISDLAILTEAERHQLLVEWNDTQKDYPQEKCLHELFEEQVDRTPAAAAAIFKDQELTYGELNARANQLAHHLRKHGVGPEVLVGVCLERSLEMLITLLGILKAGGAYLPLDPDYPEDRLAFMLEDSKARLLLTERRLAERFRQHQPIVRCLNNEWTQVRQERKENLATHVEPENLALVIYTSGTAGTPKGVLIEHRSLVNYLCWFNRAEISGNSKIFPVIAKLTVDSTLKQLFAPLLRGSQVLILPEKVIGEPSLLVQTLSTRSGIGLNCVPVLWNALLEVIESQQTPISSEALSVLLLGGEHFNSSLSDRTRAVFPDIEIWNLYGPTEATANAIAGRITCEEPIILGKPIANVKIALLDANLQPVPVGVTGELYIGGDGLARGYLGNADLTAEKFIPNPFSDEPGARLYKTGDLARYRPDGNVEFLGRSDHQVKIRGYRIEAGEIEASLSQHPAVKETVVLAREDTSEDKRLVAYVVLKSRHTLETAEARSFLKKKLPEYMVPSGFVFLDRLPLLANGKIDRNALLVTQPTLPTREKAFTAARDELELQLTQIWERILRRRPIGLKDNFFDLGGHSLLAVRLISQVEKATGRRLSLATLFQAPTIEEQAKLVRREGWSSPWSSLVPIQPGGSKPPFFSVHAHDGGVLFWRDLARRLGSDQPFYALQPRGLDGRLPPHSRIEEMAAHYIEEIRALQPVGPYFLGGHCIGGLIAYEMAQQLHKRGERVALLALFDSYAPLGPESVRDSLIYRYRRRTIRLYETIGLHAGNCLFLESKERTSYVKDKFNKALYKLYMGLGSAWVPAARHRRNILTAATEAARNYEPKIYPRKITLFRATNLGRGIERDPQMGWGGLAGGGLETHLIPGYHAHIVEEPQVRVLAAQLNTVLEKIQNCRATEQAAEEQEYPPVKEATF